MCLVLSQAVKRGKEEGFDVVLCDTSGRESYLKHYLRNNIIPILLNLLKFLSRFIRLAYKL